MHVLIKSLFYRAHKVVSAHCWAPSLLKQDTDTDTLAVELDSFFKNVKSLLQGGKRTKWLPKTSGRRRRRRRGLLGVGRSWLSNKEKPLSTGLQILARSPGSASAALVPRPDKVRPSRQGKGRLLRGRRQAPRHGHDTLHHALTCRIQH